MRTILVALVACVFAGSAFADDANWSGLYLGAHGGYGWSETDYPGAPPHPAGPPRPDREAGTYDAEAGVNFQPSDGVSGGETV